MPRSNAQADDIPSMQPLGDRLLVAVEDTADVTLGGVVLPDAAKERPLRHDRGGRRSTGRSGNNARATARRGESRLRRNAA